MSGVVAVEHGPISVISLDRPTVHNALNREVIEQLGAAHAALSADDLVRAVIITGTGDRAFSAGADLDELRGLGIDQADRVLAEGHRVFSQIEDSRLPIVAAVNGLALGGGFELALACTFMIASNNARFALPEAGLGLIPGYGGTQRLPRAIGAPAALHLMLTGDRISAGRAFELGLLPVPPVPPEDLMSTAWEVAVTLTTKGPRAMAAIKTAVFAAGTENRREALRLERQLAAAAIASDEGDEGVAAFFDRRPPDFAVVGG
ncbi:MAG TPA: enoyl-CoA hydratase/isomerase family protein [Terrimesophilobacter sp.]|nr:enoyl-CoA hydratase/isomerase family protein [Terrimesophilobacter sp.]